MRQSDQTVPTAPPHKSRLVRHLAIVLVIKVILLTILWHTFIKPNRVKVDVETMSNRIAGPQLQQPQEINHDRFNGR